MNRRGFLQGILAAGIAPVFVPLTSLMPVRAFGSDWEAPGDATILTRGDILGREFGTLSLYTAGGVLLSQMDLPMPRNKGEWLNLQPFNVINTGVLERAEVEFAGRKHQVAMNIDTECLTFGQTIQIERLHLDLGP